MSERKVYWVSPREKGWEVKLERGKRAISVERTKEEAISYGRKLASNNMPSQLKIQKADGTIETELTYGEDPFPPRG